MLQAPKALRIVRSSILLPADTSVVTMVAGSGPPLLSPDGTLLTFTARDEKGKVLLYLRSTGNSDVTRLGKDC